MPTTSKFLLLLTSSPSPSLLRPLFSLSHRGFRSPPQTFSFPLKLNLKPSSSFSHRFHSQINSNPFPPPQSPWPEFSHFVNHISASGYFGKFEDFPSPPHGFSFPHEFVNACLGFAQERGYLIGRLSRRDIDVVVGNGNANLFENGNEALTRMKAFLSSQSGAVLNADSGPMVDLMKILLSCASNFIYSENSNLHNREFLESSVRNLFNELAHLSCNASEPHVSGSSQNQFSDSNRQMSGSFQNHFSDRSGQISRPLQQNIEMKRGDWICPRCRFMNFARNTKCLECEAVRPKRQLTGGEWECPQCDFFNYGRNTVCLRCDCKRPGEVSHGISDSGSGLGYGRDNYANNADIDKRLAENEEKAQRWFSKISQMDSTSDMSSTIEDEDFPEIMPLRKGVNRFVVSTRKTPLERRLTDARYRRNSSYAGDSGISNAQGLATNNQTPRQALDDIMGRRFAASNTQQNSRADTSYSVQQQHGAPKASSSNDVPFVPLSADMFAKKTENEKIDESSKVEADKYRPLSSAAGEQAGSDFGCNDYDKSGHSWHPSNQSLSNEQEKQTKQSDRWFERVAKLDNVTDPASANPDEEFPETMPMRKGENRFVVSKKKDRSLSSPMYKRQMAMEQANNTNYVPFVPFPPDYFAKKDTQQLDGASMTNKVMGETSNYSTQANLSGKSEDIGARTSPEAEEPIIDNQQYNTVSWNSNSQEHVNQITTGTAGGLPTSVTSTQNVDPQFNMSDNRSSGFSWNEDSRGQRNAMANSQQSYFQKGGNNNNIGCSYSQNENFNQTGNSERSKPQTPENENTSSSWSGKSLEGSLVKEPDPLDMSEEAKAERWFRRVAQIKDISELSQIPDEDFPSIMPMRKGVNRFVVSKRKTPLERRLTSTSYRKNLPKVRSDPVKENDSS